MNILSFDTCLNKTYVTLYDSGKFDNKIILSTDKNYHSAFLISTIIDVLKSHNKTPKDIDYIATDIGPGSFTGIRACTTVARMLAQQLEIGLVGVSSLEILSRVNGGNDVVALDARKNKAYLYDNEILGAIDLSEVENVIKGRNVITDNNLLEILKPFSREIVSYEAYDYPLGEILSAVAVEKIESGYDTDWRLLKPLYIQPPPVYK